MDQSSMADEQLVRGLGYDSRHLSVPTPRAWLTSPYLQVKEPLAAADEADETLLKAVRNGAPVMRRALEELQLPDWRDPRALRHKLAIVNAQNKRAMYREITRAIRRNEVVTLDTERAFHEQRKTVLVVLSFADGFTYIVDPLLFSSQRKHVFPSE